MAKNQFGKLLLDKVKPVIVRESLTQFALSTAGTEMEQLKRLHDHQARTPQRNLADCTVCKGASDNRLVRCPYCGEGDENVVVAAAVEQNPNATITGDGTPRTGRKRRSENGAAEVITPDAIIPGEATPALIPAPELDKNIELIQQLKRESVVSYWRIGRAICDNFTKRLFTLRTKQDGTAKYKHFNQFVAAELGMSPQHAYRFMDAATSFTEDDVATFGVSKLAIMARVPERERPQLMERMRDDNMSLSEVHKEVMARLGGKRRNADETGRTGFRGGAEAAARGTAAAAAKATVTVGIVLGRKTIPMYRSTDPTKEARTLDHDPLATEQMLNGVTTTYKVIRAEKGLVLVITRKREEQARAPSSAAPKRPRGRPRSAAK